MNEWVPTPSSIQPAPLESTKKRRGSGNGHALPQFRETTPSHVHGLGGPRVTLQCTDQQTIGVVRADGEVSKDDLVWVMGELMEIGGNAAVFEGKVPSWEGQAVLRFTWLDGEKERNALCDEQRGLRLQHKLQLRDVRCSPRVNRIVDWGPYALNCGWDKVDPNVPESEDTRPHGFCSVHERCTIDLERWWWGAPERRTSENARRIMRRAAECLAFVHSEHVIHFDVKLSNFFLPTNDDLGSLQLADFGYARTLEGSVSKNRALTDPQRPPDTAEAPDECIAPELEECDEKRCTTKVDMFHLGLMLMLMATTRTPIHPGTRFRERWSMPDTDASVADFLQDIDRGQVCALRRTSFRTNQCESVPIQWAEWVHDTDQRSMRGLLECLLDLDPVRRLTASAVMAHSWITNDVHVSSSSSPLEIFKTKMHDFAVNVLCIPRTWCGR